MSSEIPPPRRDKSGWAILSPAVAVMNRLTYFRKFALISLLFAIPLVWVMWQLFAESVNLIGNALKFTERGEVAVDVGLVADAASIRADAGSVGHGQGHPSFGVKLHFQVRDTGIGIPPDKQGKIFAAFEQADSSTTRKYGGTGLGLSISTQLVERMSGRIWLDSEVGRGTTFHFTAQFGVAAEPNERAPDELATLHGLPVLVVDDNATNRRILQEILQQWTLAPTVSTSGPEALEELARAARAKTPYRLVLLDCMMPEMDGLEATRAIRAMELRTGGHLPIIAMTAAVVKGDREECLAAGMDGYISKPIDSARLFQVLGEIATSSCREPSGTSDQWDKLPACQTSIIEVANYHDGTNGVIDLAKARTRFPNGETSLPEFARLVYEESGKLLTEIQNALTARDAPRLQRGAHTLRGSSELFGATTVESLSAQIEAHGRDSQFDSATILLPELESATTELRAALQRVFSTS